MHRFTRRLAVLLACAIAIVAGSRVGAAPKTSEENVKVTVKAEKPAASKQVVTLTLEIAKPWHLYANPVGNKDLATSQTFVTFKQGGKPVEAQIVYPDGKVEKDDVVGDYKIYEGTITIKATLNLPGTGPVEAGIFVQTCSTSLKKCLVPSTIKLEIK